MTLTALLPSLRRSIPDPIALDRWPELTRASTTDVFVAGVSMLRVVDLFGTPCAHSAAAVLPGTDGCPSPTLRASAVVTRVTALTRLASGTLCVEVDARFEPDTGEAAGVVGVDLSAQPIFAETRLVGRASTAKVASALIADGERHWPLAHGLPGDVTVGDLLALPCRGRVHVTPLGVLRAEPPEAGHPAGPVASEASLWLSTLA